MTEELTLAIRTLTCHFCNGEGVLAHKVTGTNPFGPLAVVFGQRLCPLCSGSGLQPLKDPA